jgi:hypothetical protein
MLILAAEPRGRKRTQPRMLAHGTERDIFEKRVGRVLHAIQCAIHAKLPCDAALPTELQAMAK